MRVVGSAGSLLVVLGALVGPGIYVVGAGGHVSETVLAEVVGLGAGDDHQLATLQSVPARRKLRIAHYRGGACRFRIDGAEFQQLDGHALNRHVGRIHDPARNDATGRQQDMHLSAGVSGRKPDGDGRLPEPHIAGLIGRGLILAQGNRLELEAAVRVAPGEEGAQAALRRDARAGDRFLSDAIGHVALDSSSPGAGWRRRLGEQDGAKSQQGKRAPQAGGHGRNRITRFPLLVFRAGR